MTRPAARRLVLAVAAVAAAWAGGCASFTNPVADGIPVRRLPAELLGRPRAELQPLPLNLLRQREPEQYKLDKGDVLAIVAEELLGPRTGQPGVGAGGGAPVPVTMNPSPTARKPAFQGYPVPVQEDGTILLPELPPIKVKGLTLPEVQRLIIRYITTQDPDLPGSKVLVVPGKERVLVDLIQPRRYQINVVREDTQGGAPLQSGTGVFGSNRKGAGFTVYLEAYQNDVLHAMNATGGPPGLDARDQVVIRRGQYDPNDPSKGYSRIPLRARPDEPITFTEEDIILRDGDTVYIEARDTEVYYTAGLLGGFQVPLPRDYDLRVVEAIAQVRGPLINGGFTQNAFVAQSTNTGVGNPSPSLVSIIRRIPLTDREVVIRVDLNLAFRDTRENILIQPGDIIVLQERPGESLTRYLTQTLRFTTTWRYFQTSNANGVLVGTNP
jgi:protein involved in polysaccharide export with SLBB domain